MRYATVVIVPRGGGLQPTDRALAAESVGWSPPPRGTMTTVA